MGEVLLFPLQNGEELAERADREHYYKILRSHPSGLHPRLARQVSLNFRYVVQRP